MARSIRCRWGGLVGEDIYLVPERVQRLIGRVKSWVALRQKPVAERKVAIVLYGFPPGYGATGTAALLNVPQSLLKLLHSLKAAGYDVGDLPDDGETLIDWVKAADEADPRLGDAPLRGVRPLSGVRPPEHRQRAPAGKMARLSAHHPRRKSSGVN